MKYEQTFNTLQKPQDSSKITAPSTVITRIDILDKDGTAFVLRGVLSPSECQCFIDQAEEFGLKDCGYSHSIRKTDRVVAESKEVASWVFERIKPFLESSIDLSVAQNSDDDDEEDDDGNAEEQESNKAIHQKAPAAKRWPKGVPNSFRRWKWYPVGLNEVFRLCRYEPGGFFTPHFDGGFVRNEFERSIQTCMIYLNDDFEGGCTNFYNDEQLHYRKGEPGNVIFEFKPQAGDVLIFNSEITHDGGEIESGLKYIMRSEVMYSPLEPTENQNLCEQKRVLELFMDKVSQDTGCYCYSAMNTIKALEMGAIEHLIIWEGLDMLRYELYDKSTDRETIVCFSRTKELHVSPEVVIRQKESLLDWVCRHYERYGCKLKIVSDRSQLGKQFIMGFDGVGGILRRKVDFDEEWIDESNHIPGFKDDE